MTLSRSIIDTIPNNDFNQEQLKSFPVYGTIIHLLQQWIQKYESLSPFIKSELVLPSKLLLEAKQQTLSQDKDLVASFVTVALPKLLPTLQSLMQHVPVVDQVEE